MTASFIGRQRQLRALVHALERSPVRAIVVQGPSGAGKTALVEVVLTGSEAQGVIVGRGRYATGEMHQSLRPVLAALARATERALDKLFDPKSGTASLVTMLGDQLPLLASAGYEPAGVAWRTPAHDEQFLGELASTTRVIEATLRVLRWLDGFGDQVVLFIDDWWRASPQARTLVTAALHERSGHGLKFVLTQRSDGAAPAMPDVPQETITLGPMDADDRTQLLSAALGDAAKATLVDEWLGTSTTGLPLDLLEAVRALGEHEALVETAGQFAIDAQRAAAIDRRDFAEAIVGRIGRLHASSADLATALALWGEPANADHIALSLSLSRDDVLARLAELHPIAVTDPDGALRLAHDRFAETFLRSSDTAPLRLAARMADNLAAAAPAQWSAFDRVALRLRLFAGLATASPALWRDRFAHGSVAARSGADLATAGRFAEAAFRLRELQSAPDPDTDRLIVREAALAAASRRDVDTARHRCTLLTSMARHPREACAFQEWVILTLRLAGDADGAWKAAVEGMALFGIHVPDKISSVDLLRAVVNWRAAGLWRALRRDGDDRQGEVLARLGLTASFIGWEISPLHAAFIAIRGAAYARWRGVRSGFWTAIDAYICASTGDYERAAKLGVQACSEIKEKPASPRGFALYEAIYFGMIWGQPLASLKGGNREVYDLAIAEGDLIGAAYALRNEALIAWRTEPTLEGVSRILQDVDLRSERLGDDTSRAEIKLLSNIIQRLSDETSLDHALSYGAFTEPPGLVVEYLGLAQDWAGVHKLTQEFRHRRAVLDSHPGGVIWRFHENLAWLKLGMPADGKDLRFIARAAQLNPADHRSKLLLLRAEDLRRRGSPRCLQVFAAAVEAALAGNNRLEQGLAAECAGAAARTFGDHAAADRYRQLAVATWRSWGANAKLGELASDREADRLAAAEAKASAYERADRAKSRLLAEVGHELRTPLQGIQSMLDLAVDQPREADLKQLREAFGSLKSVVDDLTELGALGGGEASLNLRPVDLGQLILSEIAIAAGPASAAGVDLRTDLDTLGHRVFETDDARVRQVVRNLLSNALKYSGGGTVGVTLRVVSLGEMSQVTIAVQDSGPGISERDLPRLFEPFERAGRNDANGLGLGLTVSRRIADRMGGQLGVVNRPEGGSRFEFQFPARKAVAPLGEARALPALRILLVEDVPLIRHGLARLLTRDGHTVREAGTVAEATVLWKEQPADLLLLDLSLPDGDGLSLLQALRSLSGNPALPAIILTASTVRESHDRVLAAGASLLRKPISRNDLRQRIAEILGARAPDPGADAGADEWKLLSAQARLEIARRSSELLAMIDARCGDIVHAAHRLSGLATQFGDEEVARLADRLETSSTAGVPAESDTALLRSVVQYRSEQAV